MARPSHKELNGKLKAALKSVHANRIVLLEPAVLVADAVELGYSIRDELQIVLIDLLNSSSPEEYVGCRPPEKSYETKILDLELWAFPWRFQDSTLGSISNFLYAAIPSIWSRCMYVAVRGSRRGLL